MTSNIVNDFSLKESAVVTVATVITLPVRTDFPHGFVGVQFFDSIDGDTPATPGAGTVVIDVETVNNTPNFETPPNNVIDATAPTTVSFDANSKSVRATPAGVTTATHYKLVWSGNRS